MKFEAENQRNESAEPEMVKALEELDAIQSAILERFGGSLTTEQTESLRELMQLDFHLRGPDDRLDRELYSRALPPPRIRPQHPSQRE
jgi:hypothetical protein